jgi:biotin operon repressor
MHKPRWTFLTNYAHVFIYIARNPRSTTREISIAVGITERAVQKIIQELEAEGYIVRFKKGRNNIYEVDQNMPMRHPLQGELAVGELLIALDSKVKTASPN